MIRDARSSRLRVVEAKRISSRTSRLRTGALLSRLSGASVLLLLLIGGSADFAHARSPNRCATVGETEVVNSVARVYSLKTGGVFGCYVRSGRRYLIDPENSLNGTYEFRLAGQYVIVDDYDDDVRPGERDYSVIVLRNLRSGRVRRVSTAGAGAAEDIVLKPNGSFAEIRRAGVFNASIGASPLQVRRFDSRGKRVLSEGVDVAPRSLLLTRSTIFWRKGGRRVRATLR